MTTVALTAKHVDLTAEDYHAHPAIGSSMLETFRKSRREFYGRYVSKEIPPKEPTAAMQLGTLVHMAILEPERFAETVVTMPNLYMGEEWNWRKPSHRDARDAMKAQFASDGKTCIELSEWESIESMVKAVRSNKYAHRLVSAKGKPEFSIFWTDALTGLELKARVDWMAAIPLDIKTTNDPTPEAYARTVVSLGYHRKNCHYLQGIAAFNGEQTPMVQLAVETVAPHRVAPYDLDDRDLDGRSLGWRQWRETLSALKQCMDSGDWRDPWEKQITTLRLPGWAFSQESYQVGG